MTAKQIVRKIHLWLGLTSGLVIFVVAVTGCIYAFQEEIQNMTQPYRFVTVENKPVRLPSQLQEIAQQALPGKKIHAVLFARPGKAAQVIFYALDADYYYKVYLNPYDGRILEVKDENKDFFRFVLMGHFYFWLPPLIGQPVVASATGVFGVMLISGLILWWPKNRKAAPQRFTIKWSARWRRKNYDLHNVLGFYSTWVLILLTVTGLVWGFQGFARAWYAVAGGQKSLEYSDPGSDTTGGIYVDETPAIDRLYRKIYAENPKAEIIEVHIPESAAAAIEVSINPDDATYWRTDYRYFDQYTLEELSVSHIYGRLAEASRADKLLRMNYDLHTGAVLGLPGKLLAFFAGLIAASLPVTGCYIWWGRKKRGRSDAITNAPLNNRAVAQVVMESGRK